MHVLIPSVSNTFSLAKTGNIVCFHSQNVKTNNYVITQVIKYNFIIYL